MYVVDTSCIIIIAKVYMHSTWYNSNRHRDQGTYSIDVPRLSTGQYLDIALTAVHYGPGIYCHGGIRYDVYIIGKSVHSYRY